MHNALSNTKFLTAGRSVISVMPSHESCDVTFHSVNHVTTADIVSYSAYIVLSSPPDTNMSNIITSNKTNTNLTSLQSDNLIPFCANYNFEIINSEKWLEILITNKATNIPIYTSYIEVDQLYFFHPYNIILTHPTQSNLTPYPLFNITLQRYPSVTDYYGQNGLEVCIIDHATTNNDQLAIEDTLLVIEISKQKPTVSYKPLIKFGSYKEQHSKRQNIYLSTPKAINNRLRHYIFLPDISYEYNLESSYVIISFYSTSNISAPWIAPSILAYLCMDTDILSNLATESSYRNLTDKLTYLTAGTQITSYYFLFNHKRNDTSFMCIPSDKNATIENDVINQANTNTNGQIDATECHTLQQAYSTCKELLSKVNEEKAILLNENIALKNRLDNNSSQYGVQNTEQLNVCTKNDLIRRLQLLQQEYELLKRKHATSQDNIAQLNTVIEEHADVIDKYTQLQEAHYVQQDIISVLQERSSKYKKLSTLCANQEKTIELYENECQNYLKSEAGGYVPLFINKTAQTDREEEEVTKGKNYDNEETNDQLISDLQARLLQSSMNMNQRSDAYTVYNSLTNDNNNNNNNNNNNYNNNNININNSINRRKNSKLYQNNADNFAYSSKDRGITTDVGMTVSSSHDSTVEEYNKMSIEQISSLLSNMD